MDRLNTVIAGSFLPPSSTSSDAFDRSWCGEEHIVKGKFRVNIILQTVYGHVLVNEIDIKLMIVTVFCI